MSSRFKRVLITGTTSGLGREFLIHYASRGHEVVAINRREAHELYDWKIEQKLLDITNYEEVFQLVKELKAEQRLPDLWILNSGINRTDNLDGLRFGPFRDVMRTNLEGVMTFVGAIHDLGITGKTITSISSTSNMVPNPSHVGYFISKLALREAFACLQKKDSKNRYKTVILSPVWTNIMRGYPKPQGLQGKILDWLGIPPAMAAEACAHFFEWDKPVFYYTKPACLFYFFVRWLLKAAPGLYQGTTARPAGVPAES